MSECKYCLQCKPETLGSVSAFLKQFPNGDTPDTSRIEGLMANTDMNDWVLERRSFANMRHRLIPVNDDNLGVITISDEGKITCLRVSDDEVIVLKP